MYFVAPIRPEAANFIKPLASCIYSLVKQWKATLRNDVGLQQCTAGFRVANV